MSGRGARRHSPPSSMRARRRLPARRPIRISPRSSTPIRDSLGPSGREVTLSDPRTGESQAMRMTFEQVLGALAAVHLRAGARGALAGGHRPRRRRRFRTALFRRDARDQRFRRAVEYGAPLLGDLRGGRPARLGGRRGPDARAAAHEVARRARALGVHRVAEGCGAPDATTPVKSDVPVLILSGGLDPVTPPANGAEVAKSLPASATSSLAATATSCPRMRAGRGSSPPSSTTRRSRRCPRRASSISRRVGARRFGPTGSGPALDRRRESRQGVRPTSRSARRRRRGVHRARSRDHRAPRDRMAPARRRSCGCSRR